MSRIAAILWSVFVLALMLCAALALAGCGGGGGSGGSGEPPVAGQVLVSSPSPVAPPVPASVGAGDCTIGLYGDSLMVDAPVFVAETFPATMRRLRPAWTIVDHAIAGSIATVQVLTFHPTEPIAVIEWGLNDFINGPFDITGPLTVMVQNARAAGVTPVLTGVIGTKPDWAQQVEARTVASNLQVPYAGWDTLSGGSPDGTHADQALSIAMATALVQTLDPVCAGLKK